MEQKMEIIDGTVFIGSRLDQWMGINIFLLKHTNKKMTSFLMIIFALLNFEKNNNAN